MADDSEPPPIAPLAKAFFLGLASVIHSFLEEQKVFSNQKLGEKWNAASIMQQQLPALYAPGSSWTYSVRRENWTNWNTKIIRKNKKRGTNKRESRKVKTKMESEPKVWIK